jgi:hypothetical protein
VCISASACICDNRTYVHALIQVHVRVRAHFRSGELWKLLRTDRTGRGRTGSAGSYSKAYKASTFMEAAPSTGTDGYGGRTRARSTRSLYVNQTSLLVNVFRYAYTYIYVHDPPTDSVSFNLQPCTSAPTVRTDASQMPLPRSYINTAYSSFESLSWCGGRTYVFNTTMMRARRP